MLEVENVCNCTLHQLRQTTRAVAKIYDSALVDVGLRSTQFSLLATLQECKLVSLSELAMLMVMDRTTLTRNLKALSMAGYVDTLPAEQDKRIKLLRLSDTGHQILEKATPLWRLAQLQITNKLGKERWSILSTELNSLTKLVQ